MINKQQFTHLKLAVKEIICIEQRISFFDYANRILRSTIIASNFLTDEEEYLIVSYQID